LDETANIQRVLDDVDLYRNLAYPKFSCGVTEKGMRPNLVRRMRALEALAITMSATSEVGAVWQLLLSYNLGAFDDLIGRVTDNNHPARGTHTYDLEERRDMIMNTAFSAAYVLVKKLNHPDLNMLWQSYLACDDGVEEREGAATDAVLAAAAKRAA